MLETIEAALPAWNEPPHSSPGEAIEFSKLFDRMHYKQEVEACIRQTIKSVRWNDCAVRLYFDSNKIIQIQLLNGVADYVVVDSDTHVPFDQSGMGNAVSLRLAGQEVIWERAELLKKLQGNLLQQIFVTPNLLFLYVSKVGILLISALTNLRTGREFLFWEPSD